MKYPPVSPNVDGTRRCGRRTPRLDPSPGSVLLSRMRYAEHQFPQLEKHCGRHGHSRQISHWLKKFFKDYKGSSRLIATFLGVSTGLVLMSWQNLSQTAALEHTLVNWDTREQPTAAERAMRKKVQQTLGEKPRKSDEE